MERKFKSRQIIKIILTLLNNKEKIFQLLVAIDQERFEKGTISLHQDIINRIFHSEILESLDLLDFQIKATRESIRLEITKKIRIMFMDMEIKSIINLKDYYLSFGNNNYGFFAIYNISFEGLPRMIDKLPGGESVKDTIINAFLKNGAKDIKWIKIAGDSIIIDLNKSEEFLHYKEEGMFGIDIINEVSLSEFRTEQDRVLIDYIWED